MSDSVTPDELNELIGDINQTRECIARSTPEVGRTTVTKILIDTFTYHITTCNDCTATDPILVQG